MEELIIKVIIFAYNVTNFSPALLLYCCEISFFSVAPYFPLIKSRGHLMQLRAAGVPQLPS